MTVRAKLVVGDFDGGITDGTIPFSYISSGSTNCMLVKRGQGCLSSMAAMSVSASVRYLKLYDVDRRPIAAGIGTPLRRYAIPASTTGRGIVLAPKIPIQFYRGLAFTITGGAADSDTTAIAANEIILNLECAPGVPEGPPSAADFFTDFPLTENPIVLGGILQRGLSDGLDWTNARTTTNKAFGSTTVAGFDDALSHLKLSYRPFRANQFARGTVFRTVGYTSDVGHEVELLLRFSITAHDAHGYEVLWAHDGRINLVRWNGALGDYSAFDVVETNIGAPAEGDVLLASVVGTAVTVQKNGSTVKTWDLTDIAGTVWATGQPGFGFWPQSGGTTDPTKFGWKDYSAGDL